MMEKAEKIESKISLKDPFIKYRITKQVLLVMVWVTMGLTSEIVGPTLPDLRVRYRSNYSHVSQALGFKDLGFVLGCLFGGFLCERHNRKVELFMSIGYIISAIGTVAIPWGHFVPVLGVLQSVIGAVEGVINAGGNTAILQLWEASAAPFMHLLHFGFGFGAMISPQIARPFLSPDARNDTNSYTSGLDRISLFGTLQDNSRIEYAYLIVGCFSVLISFLLFIFYIRGPPKEFPIKEPSFTKLNKEAINPAVCAGGKAAFGLQMLVCLFLYFGLAVGSERAMGRFLMSFSVESELKFTKQRGTVLNSVFWLCFTFGRLSGVGISKVLRTQVMIGLEVVGVALCGVAFSIAGHNVPVVTWVFSAFIGYFIALLYPSGMAWSNLYLEMNAVAVMVLNLGGSVGGFLFVTGGGPILYQLGPRSLMFMMLTAGLMMVVLFTVMQILASRRGERFSRVKIAPQPAEDEVEIVTVSGKVLAKEKELAATENKT